MNPPPKRSIYLRHFNIVIGRLSSVVAGLPLAFVANALDEVLVEITDVQMPNLQEKTTSFMYMLEN